DLSGGMKQKLALCCALIHKPELLILDEPTTGVDAVSRQDFWQMLQRLQEQNLTIIASTPYMDEAKQCGRVALIDDGQILQIGSPREVVSGFEKPLLAIKADNIYRLINTLRNYRFADSVQPFGEFIHYTDRRKEPDVQEIKSYLLKNQLHDIIIQPVKPGIEDSFIELMKKEGGHE
ncbi:MAG TPA: ATP-binding cassette domain-containing protein, partial [Balneolaceae bacterium]|nr:ATP-binding cassette domain-containing protein [Balneolaceae bacterium]